MKYIFDFLIGIAIAAIFVISFMDYELIKQLWWIGIAIGIGSAFTISKWNKDKIDDLEKKIDELKNDNREEIA